MSARLILGVVAAAWATAAGAGDVLVDPMRPPAAHRQAEREPLPAQQPLLLQSTRISSAHRSAVISGVTVQAGDRIGGAVVSRISDGEVLLELGGVEQVLKLYPAVDKRAAEAAAKPRPRAPGDATRGGPR